MSSVSGVNRHRALGSARRQSVLEVLRVSIEPMDTAEVARHVGFKRNAARSHLDQLVQAGLVTRRTEARSVRGRPRVLFSLAAAAADEMSDSRETEYEDLALLLARQLSDGGDVEEVAERAGRQWARELEMGEFPEHPSTIAEARDTVSRVFENLGFEPMVESDGDIVLRRCPFMTVALEHQSLICGLHLGTLREIADRIGLPARSVSLSPFESIEPLRCVVQFREDPVDTTMVAIPTLRRKR